MARRCFEVGKFIFTFCSEGSKLEKTNFVFEGMRKYLKSYASNTEFEISSKTSDGCDIGTEVNITLSKKISLITANTILARMLGEKIIYMSYIPSKRLMSIVAMG